MAFKSTSTIVSICITEYSSVWVTCIVKMNQAIIIFIACAILTSTSGLSPPHPCPCWQNWEPVKEEGNQWHCKDKNSESTFACNVDRPPICVCKEKATGTKVDQPLGVINCVNIENPTLYDHRDCESNSQWEEWFSKYPQYRLYD